MGKLGLHNFLEVLKYGEFVGTFVLGEIQQIVETYFPTPNVWQKMQEITDINAKVSEK